MQRLRVRWSDEEGMSLVEIMVAIFVLGVALMALGSTVLTSIVSLRVSRARQEATDAASALIEDLRRTDYASVALDGNDPDVQAYMTSSGGCDPDFDEPLVSTTQPGGIPREQSFGPSGRVTVRTSVSWYDEGDDQVCGAVDHERAVKRVQVVAEWQDADRTYSVQESTLVASVDRGLPAPDFRLGTPVVSTTFTPSDRDAARARCIGHVLRNLGAADSYEVDVKRTDGQGVTRTGDQLFLAPNSNRWTVRVFFSNPAQDPPVDPATLGVPWSHNQRTITGHPYMELMLDEVGDGNDLPEAQSTVATGEQARVWVCYRPGSSLSVGDTAAFEVTVFSRFDPNRFETLTHNLDVSDSFLNWYLFDDFVPPAGVTSPTTTQASTTRVVGTGGNAKLPVLLMGPETTLEPELLGATSALPNYDTDFDNYPGTRLLDSPRKATSEAAWPASRIAWHQQVSPTTTFDNDLQLTIWTASQNALDAAATGSAVTTKTLTFKARVQVLKSNEKQVEATLLDFTSPGATLSYSHTTAGWTQQTWNIALPADFTVQDKQYLRLELLCDQATSSGTCHVAYDHQLFPSRLRLQARS